MDWGHLQTPKPSEFGLDHFAVVKICCFIETFDATPEKMKKPGQLAFFIYKNPKDH